MGLVYKEYNSAFLLEPTKLTRILDVIHEQFAENSNTTLNDRFEVFMTGNRSDELKTLEQVLDLENSKKHTITRLLVKSSALTDDAQRTAYEVQIDFGVVQSPKNAPTAPRVKLVTIDVRSDTARWNTQTLSRVEEQLERTWLPRTFPVVALLTLILIMAVLFLVQLKPVFRPGSFEYSRIMWLDDKELDLIEKAAKENRTMTDAELREISTGQLRNVLLYQRPKNEPQPGRNRPLVLFGLPFLLLVAVSFYLGFRCYPTAVFLWGDEVDRYKKVLTTRKVLWTVIVGILVVGVASKLLAEVVLSWIPK